MQLETFRFMAGGGVPMNKREAMAEKMKSKQLADEKKIED